MEFNATTTQLDQIAQSVGEIVKLSSKIGDIGYSPDFSNNTLANQMENNHPLVTWLLNTPMTTQMRNAARSGLAPIHKDAQTGEWMLMIPYSVGTLPPDDTTGACCWVPLEIAKCGGAIPLRLLCLKDCENIMDNFINENRVAGSNDLINVFLRQGESVKDARVRMAKMSMAFFTAYNIVLGVTGAGTKFLKPFHGLLEILEGADVINILGTNILGAFESLSCRWNILSGGSYVIWVHPLTKQAIESVVVEGKNGKLPKGWTRNGNDIAYNGHPVREDKVVPVDVTAGTGEAWVLDGDTTGAYMATDLSPGQDYIRHGFTSTDDPSQGCATECDFYYNLGGTFNTNPNRLAMITDIPLDANCLGNSLQGLDGLISPNTLVPMT